MSELDYVKGSRAAYRSMLQHCLRELGYEKATGHEWILEREAAIASLRSLCEDLGDNDWPENLHLSDIIEKHVAPHIERNL